MSKFDFQFSSMAPNLKTDDINKTVEFYQKIGFKFIIGVKYGTKEIVSEHDGKVKLQFAKLSNGSCTLLFDEDGNYFDKSCKIGGSFMIYIQVKSNLKQFYDHVVNNKLGKIMKEYSKAFYGPYEFFMEDNNGYCLGFAEEHN